LSEHPTPRGLGPEGRKVWREHTSGYTLNPSELVALRSAAKTADTIARLEKLLKEGPAMVRGSAGQPVLHPAEAELRMQHSLLGQLLARVNMPDESSDGASEWDGLTASQRARKASLIRHNGVRAAS
jgi:hypothetical protein